MKELTKPFDPRFYRRNLPHIQPRKGIFFITFRLEGSLPAEVIYKLQTQRKLLINKAIALIPSEASDEHTEITKNEIIDRINQVKELYWGKFEDLLDNPSSGPVYLKQAKVAGIVADGMHFFDKERYTQICFSIMPNHVHWIIFDTKQVLFRILQSVKRHTARLANIHLNRTGSFWHKESYDRIIRNDLELKNKILYTLNNPVKAGLVDHWRAWPHTYLNPELEEFIQT